jgi:hypothetical protein
LSALAGIALGKLPGGKNRCQKAERQRAGNSQDFVHL